MKYTGFLRKYSRDLGLKNGIVYEDDGFGYAEKPNKEVKDMERQPAEMHNDGDGS